MKNPTAWTLSIRRLRVGLGVLNITLVIGTIGFYIFEDWNLFESFYVALLVVATLGFGSLQPATLAGQVLTMVLISAGVGTLYYLVGIIAELAIEGQLGYREERRMQQQISRLHDHVIICGYGRVGQQVILELQREEQPFVIVEPNPAKVRMLVDRGILVYEGDASEDRVLYAVGIDRAKALLVCSGTDAVNVFITLSARAINEKLMIAARAIREEDEPKLLRAGANRVITPASLGGRRLVSLVLRPNVVDWLDVLVHTDNLELWMEELFVRDLPGFHHQALLDLRLRPNYGINILAIKRGTEMLTMFDPYIKLEPEDVLIALGARSSFNRLREAANNT